MPLERSVLDSPAYFGIDKVYPGEAGELLREHRYLAADPDRTEGDETKPREIDTKLRREGLFSSLPPLPRAPPRSWG